MRINSYSELFCSFAAGYFCCEIFSLAQEESRSISENVTWGQRKRMADGKVSLPYGQFLGYRKGEDGLPEIVESEAEIVRIIFRLFIEGKTPSAIAKFLETKGILSPGGKKKWQVATVKSHWFNPLVWIAFMLMSTDMELSCDERVLKLMNADIKKPYANSLLSLAAGRHILNSSPLAFGEGNVKGRIKNVLKYKKPKYWVIIFSIIIVTVGGIGLMLNPEVKETDEIEQITDFAWKFINKDIANYESNPEVNIIDSKITRLELIETFVKLSVAPIEIYELEYRLLPEDLSKVVLAGGMQVDEDGWLKETSSMGRPLLVVLRNRDSTEFIGVTWTGEVGKLGLEPAIKSLLEPTVLVPTSPELSLEQDLGVGMPELDYASDDIVIFHGYFGLFVYDLNTLQIIRSIDLKPLNCHQTQGSNYCDVSVSVDGNTVHLHPMESENMYIYTVSSNTLQETPYQRMEKRFTSVPIEDVIDSTKLGIYGYNAARFDTGEYGYLQTSNWTLGTLSYVRGDMVYPLFVMKE